jgi:esterase/lipase superfamily enzyme/uncharacterized protein YjbI with pentapeptide repeats
MVSLTLTELSSRFEQGERDFSRCRISNSDDSAERGLVADSVSLREADLTSLRLRLASFKHADFTGAALNSSILWAVNLTGAVFIASSLESATFTDSDFRLAVLHDANLKEARFQRCCLTQVDFTAIEGPGPIRFRECSMSGANLSGIRLQDSMFEKCDLSEARLDDAHLYKSDFFGSNFRRASLARTNLYEADLRQASFTSANLAEANLSNSMVGGATFVRANLNGTNLWGIDGKGTIWRDAKLEDAQLDSAKLTGATFINVDLSRASLRNADLLASSFFNVNATEADLTDACLDRGVIVQSVFSNARLANTNLWLAELDEASRSSMDASVIKTEYPRMSMSSAGGEVMYLENSEVATHAIVKVFYATDRANTGNERPADMYGSEWAKELHFGVCDVSIPREHKMGALEAPSIWKLQWSYDVEKHVTLVAATRDNLKNFASELQERLDASQRRSGLVFIHGYNVSFEDAVRRTAQLAYDLSFDGPAITYSWPSADLLRGYVTDTNSAERTAPNLALFIRELLSNEDLDALQVIAHSMGNKALLYALPQVISGSSSVPKIANVVFTAPDVDAQVFTDSVPRVLPAARSFTLYASSRDRALNASKLVNGFQRAGDAGGALLVVPPVLTIDASDLDTDLMGHSYFGDNKSVISDMFYLMKGLLPDERHSLHPEFKDGLKYWRFEG